MMNSTSQKKGFWFYYLCFIVNLGQSVHFIQAWKIFKTTSAEDISLTAYIICITLVAHWLLYGLYIKNYVLVVAEILGIIGCIFVIVGIHLY